MINILIYIIKLKLRQFILWEFFICCLYFNSKTENYNKRIGQIACLNKLRQFPFFFFFVNTNSSVFDWICSFSATYN